jgi:excisionase family DNA binding protein
MNQLSDLLTITEFATALRLKPSCIRRWIGERRIETVRVGRLVRIPSTEIERIICEGTTPAARSARK